MMEKEPTLRNRGSEYYEASETQEDDSVESDSRQTTSANAARRLLARILQWRETKRLAQQLKQVRTEEVRAVREAKRTADDPSKMNRLKKILKRNRNTYEKTHKKATNIDHLDELN